MLSANGKTDLEKFEGLEKMAVVNRKKPTQNSRSREIQTLLEKQSTSINKSYADDYIEKARTMTGHGIGSTVAGDMSNVLKHDYLRESMAHRIQRKALY